MKEDKFSHELVLTGWNAKHQLLADFRPNRRSETEAGLAAAAESAAASADAGGPYAQGCSL